MNYHKEMLNIIKSVDKGKKLLLHTCCAPCSTTAILALSDTFKITIYYYNPNIYPKEEYEKRKQEQIRLINEIKTKYPINFIDASYNPEDFFDIAKGLEEEKERGKRCYLCYQLRLENTARKAKELGYDYFGTSLSVSPYKNALWINEIGLNLEKKYNIPFLVSDFKKDNGYLKSILMSKKYNLYRQDFCGCVYSKKEKNS